MHALQPGAAGEAWKALGRRLPRPKAILIASAHWETNLPMLTGVRQARDDPRLLQLPRAALPAALSGARRARGRAARAGAAQGRRLHRRHRRLPRPRPRRVVAAPLHVSGRGHPRGADLACSRRWGRGTTSQLGRSLRKLGEEGVLIIGSGHMTHNLRDWARGQGAPAPYAQRIPGLGIRQAEQEGHRQPGRLPLALRRTACARIRPTSISCRCSSRSAPLRTKPKPERVYDAIDSRRAGDGRLRVRLDVIPAQAGIQSQRTYSIAPW